MRCPYCLGRPYIWPKVISRRHWPLLLGWNLKNISVHDIAVYDMWKGFEKLTLNQLEVIVPTETSLNTQVSWLHGI